MVHASPTKPSSSMSSSKPKQLRLALVVCGLLSALPALSANGNLLLANCQVAERFLDTDQLQNDSSTGISVGRCMGLLHGVMNSMIILESALASPSARTCWPKEAVQVRQAVRIAVRYLKDNPQNLHHDETFLAILAYKSAFPCRKTP
jgi:Rap1a immunity proteins